ncbi:MAG: Uncharacterized protein Greene041679_105 [Parcubacteria group bacterium Greene0416_79]|nr:MAG: Uncharacterized protein Greene041679_105 [Parcubacteria group bacterium Greene0416_79]
MDYINVFMKNNNSQKGFAMPIVIAIVALVVVIGGVAYFATRPQSSVNDEVMKKDSAAMERAPDNTREKKDGETMMKDEGSMMEKKDDAMMKGETLMKKEGEAMMTKYTGTVLAGASAPLLEYNKADYDAAIASDKLVVLYFYANWCPICKVEFPIIQETFNELTTDKVIGIRINYKDSNTDKDEENLARQYGITYQHTKVFVKNGTQVLKAPDTWDDKRYDIEISKYLPQ